MGNQELSFRTALTLCLVSLWLFIISNKKILQISKLHYRHYLHLLQYLCTWYIFVYLTLRQRKPFMWNCPVILKRPNLLVVLSWSIVIRWGRNSFFTFSKDILALLACSIVMDVCLCFHANVFNSWFNFLFNSCRFYVALVSSTPSYLRCFWYWCITMFLTFENSWSTIGETFRARKGRAMATKGQWE